MTPIQQGRGLSGTYITSHINRTATVFIRKRDPYEITRPLEQRSGAEEVGDPGDIGAEARRIDGRRRGREKVQGRSDDGDCRSCRQEVAHEDGHADKDGDALLVPLWPARCQTSEACRVDG